MVVPAALFTNWNKDVQHFAPSLRVRTHHRLDRTLALLKDADILL